MDKDEAKRVLGAQLAPYRAMAYGELVKLINAEPVVFQASGPSGTAYNIEIEAFWDDRSQTNVRLMGAIDDGGWRAFRPLTDDFILSPDGTFIGE